MQTAISSTYHDFHNPKLKVTCVKFTVCLFENLLQTKQEFIQKSHIACVIEAVGVGV